MVPRASAALRFLYLYTIVGAGLVGLWMLAAPASFARGFGLPDPDRYLLGIVGAVYAGFGMVAALGLRRPLTFAPVFVLQLAYKALWLGAVFAPSLVVGSAPQYAWVLAGVFASYVALDVIAIPFRSLFSTPSDSTPRPRLHRAPELGGTVSSV